MIYARAPRGRAEAGQSTFLRCLHGGPHRDDGGRPTWVVDGPTEPPGGGRRGCACSCPGTARCARHRGREGGRVRARTAPRAPATSDPDDGARQRHRQGDDPAHGVFSGIAGTTRPPSTRRRRHGRASTSARYAAPIGGHQAPAAPVPRPCFDVPTTLDSQDGTGRVPLPNLDDSHGGTGRGPWPTGS